LHEEVGKAADGRRALRVPAKERCLIHKSGVNVRGGAAHESAPMP
jgi:hypothetical protein